MDRIKIFVSIHHILNALGEKSDLSAGWTMSMQKKRSIHQYESIFLHRHRSRCAKYGFSVNVVNSYKYLNNVALKERERNQGFHTQIKVFA